MIPSTGIEDVIQIALKPRGYKFTLGEQAELEEWQCDAFPHVDRDELARQLGVPIKQLDATRSGIVLPGFLMRLQALARQPLPMCVLDAVARGFPSHDPANPGEV